MRAHPRLRLLPRDAADAPADDTAPGPRPKGSRRPHRNATVAQVRKLIEKTPYTYAEIAARMCRWRRAPRSARAGGEGSEETGAGAAHSLPLSPRAGRG